MTCSVVKCITEHSEVYCTALNATHYSREQSTAAGHSRNKLKKVKNKFVIIGHLGFVSSKMSVRKYISTECKDLSNCQYINRCKNPAYGRQCVSQPVQIEAPLPIHYAFGIQKINNKQIKLGGDPIRCLGKN